MVNRVAVLCLALSACGDDGGVRADAMVDAVPDAYVPPVTVTVERGSGPAQGLRVYFQAKNSELVASVLTDANGEASAVLPPDGFVTVIDPKQTSYRNAVTFTAAQPGDDFRLFAVPDETGMQSVTVNGPRSATADHYRVWTSCGVIDGNTSVSTNTIAKQVGLVGCPATFDLILAAENASDQLIEAIVAENVSISSQGTIDLTARSYVAATTHTVAIANLPANHSAAVQDSLGGTRGLLFGAYATTSTSTSLAFPMPVIANADNSIRVTVTPMAASPFKRHVFERGTYTASKTIDLAASFVSDLTGCPTIDRAAQTVAWTAAAGGVAPDIQFVDFTNLGSTSWTYTVVGPATPLMQLPTLPTDAFNFNIRDSSTALLEKMVLATIPNGYGAIRHEGRWQYPNGAEVLDAFGSGAALHITGAIESGCP